MMKNRKFYFYFKGNGIWIIFPDEPLGPSKDKGYMQFEEAKRTAFYEFENNVAHSNLRVSLVYSGHIFQSWVS